MTNYDWNNTEYLGESNPEEKNSKIDAAAIEATRRRRRIEDIKEAARLERDVLEDVWD